MERIKKKNIGSWNDRKIEKLIFASAWSKGNGTIEQNNGEYPSYQVITNN